MSPKVNGDQAISVSDKLASTLDALDRVRIVLIGEPDLANTLDSFPQFVVVGGQSSGKSSNFTRMSGVGFPTNSERCTRVAILLRLRRQAFEPVTVSLRGPDGFRESFPIEPEQGVTKAIKDAQDRAIELSGNVGFAEKYEVEVHVQDPKVPNVTLVDLPGLLAPKPGSNEPEMVRNIVKKYVEMDGSLILNVVDVSQDYDTTLGKDIIHDHRDKTTYVLTKFDFLCQQGDDIVRKRMAHVINETKAPRFMVWGNFAGERADEPSDLLDLYGEIDLSEIGLGVEALNEQVETSIREHLEKQLPVVRKVVEGEIIKCEKRLDEIKHRAPSVHVSRTVQIIRQAYSSKRLELETFFRKQREALYLGIRNCHLKPLFVVTNTMRRAEANELEIGVEVQCNEGGEYLESATITSIVGQDYTCVTNKGDKTPKVFSLSQIYSRENVQSDMIKDVQRVAENVLGISNLAHVDTQKVLNEYAKDWSKQTAPVFAQALERCIEFVDKSLDDIFLESKVPPAAKAVALRLRARVDEKCEEVRTDAFKCLKRVARYNEPPLVFTSNEHYLDQIYRDLVGNDDSGSTNEGAAKLLYFKLRAYIKVQTKVVSEAVTKDLVGCFLVDVENAVNSVLDEALAHDKYLDDVKESNQNELQRKKFEKKLSDLKHVAEELKNL